MADNAKRSSDDAQRAHWARIDAYLRTDPRDPGCDACLEMLDVYVEMVADGDDPAERFPGLDAHFSACGSCAEDAAGLLSALAGGASTPPDQP